MFASVESNRYGHYLLTTENGKDIYYQTDWEYPSLAELFGWCPETDDISEQIAAAIEFLDNEPCGDVPDELFEEVQIVELCKKIVDVAEDMEFVENEEE